MYIEFTAWQEPVLININKIIYVKPIKRYWKKDSYIVKTHIVLENNKMIQVDQTYHEVVKAIGGIYE